MCLDITVTLMCVFIIEWFSSFGCFILLSTAQMLQIFHLYLIYVSYLTGMA